MFNWESAINNEQLPLDFGINVTKLKHYLFAVAFRVGALYNISTQRERVLITRFEPPNLSPSADGEAPSRASLITPRFIRAAV